MRLFLTRYRGQTAYCCTSGYEIDSGKRKTANYLNALRNAFKGISLRYDGWGEASACGTLGCELRLQKRHYKDRVDSVLIDSEVRTSVPQMLTNFRIGTLAERNISSTARRPPSGVQLFLWKNAGPAPLCRRSPFPLSRDHFLNGTAPAVMGQIENGAVRRLVI
jgi:hypothetical protein